MQLFKFTIASVFVLALAACGGGGGAGGIASMGKFIDDPVQGLSYSCSGAVTPTAGFTNSAGEFSFYDGQTCSFKIGNVTLGPAVKVGSDSVITPQDVAGVSRNATDAPSTLAIAQFLQSFHDGSSTGKIVIPQDVHTKLAEVQSIALVSATGVVSQAKLTELVTAVPGKVLVSADTAKVQLVKQIDSGIVNVAKGSADTTRRLNSIQVTTSVSENAAGLTETFTAMGYYSDGSPPEKLTTGVTWSSSDPSIVKLTENVGKGLAVGSAVITASYTPQGMTSAVSGSVTQKTTEATISNLVISFVKGVVASITSGAEESLQAIATFSDESKKTVSAAVKWAVTAATGSSGAAEISTITDGATLKAGAAGFIDIVAQYLGLTSNKLSIEITTKITGVVAVGAPLPAATVTLVDVSGQKAEAVTNALGEFEVVNSVGQNLVPPFALSTTKSLGDKVYVLNSVASNNFQTANITPLTTAAVALINSGAGYDPTNLNLNKFTPSTLDSAIEAANKTLATALKPLLVNAQVSDYQPISGKFTANNTGLDKVMDQVGLNISSSGLNLVNKFEILKESASSNSVSITASQSSVTELKLGAEPPDKEMLQSVIAKIEACFKIDADKRVKFTTDGAGRDIYTSGSLHTTCANFLRDEYRHQGQPFGQRWLYYLKDAQFDGIKVSLVPLYVVDKKDTYLDAQKTQPFPGDDQIAYVYNILLTDKNGLIYTSPDVFIKDNKQFKLLGNRRKFNVSIQPYYTRVTNFRNLTDEYVEARIRPGIDPSFTFDASSGFGKFFSTTDGTKPLPKILCAWVTGPLLQNGVSHDPNAPKGGVLLKAVWSELTQRQDYMAPRVKYPFDFDPIGNSTHKSMLYNDCKNSNHEGNNATPETNSTFATDWLNTNSVNTRTFGYTWLTKPYPTTYYRYEDANIKTCPLSSNTAKVPEDKVAGWCNPTKRETAVTALERATFEKTYADPKNIIFTFYLFIDPNYSESAPGTSFSGTTTANAFMDLAEVMQIRMAGTLAFLDTKTVDGKVIYAGAEKYLTIGDTTLTKYLSANKSTLAKGEVVDFSWEKSVGDSGGDRIGLGGWYMGKKCGAGSNSTTCLDPGTTASIIRVGPKTYSDSFGIDKSKNSGSYNLPEDWYGFDHTTATRPQGYYSLTNSYREIWIRSYDSKNRVIQSVYNATQ